MGILEAAFSAMPMARRAARGLSDWIDLQWSYTTDDLRRVAPSARGRLLDVGCGNKPYAEIFRPFVSEYIGVEHEASFSMTNAQADRATSPDVLYDGHRLPFADESFDTLLNIQVLEHTPAPQALLNEMARVLKKDGLLILSVPFCFRLHEEPHDYFRYTPHGIRTMCEVAGLEVTEMHAQGSLGSVLGHKLNSYLAFRVARIQGMAQSLGKLSHEGTAQKAVRLWTLPFVVPTMSMISLAARATDRVMPDPTETLSFLAMIRRAG
jgi:SAM-dependent methyltransferase